MYLWTKAFHIIFMVTWFAGLFYLPRLYVYHSQTQDQESINRFKLMERRLYFGIMLPAIVLTLSSGLSLMWMKGWDWFIHTPWMQLKLAVVLCLIIFHFYLGQMRKLFDDDRNQKSALYFKIINEIPVLVLISVVLLAELKPW